MVDLSIWYGMGAAILLVGAVAFVSFAMLRGDLGSPYYSLPPLHALLGAVSYAALALVTLDRLAVATPGMIRFAGLFLTAPVAVYYLGLLASASAELRVTAVSLTMVAVAVAYFATVTVGGLRLGLAALSGVLLLSLAVLIVRSFAPLAGDSSLFLSLQDLTISVLFAYAAIYVLGSDRVGLLSASDFGFLHLALDVVLALGFVALVFARQYEVADRVSGAPSPG
jgi:bacteriorhodopsin